jgi:hypothetical protein
MILIFLESDPDNKIREALKIKKLRDVSHTGTTNGSFFPQLILKHRPKRNKTSSLLFPFMTMAFIVIVRKMVDKM